MKNYAFLILLISALAGCSSSLKGSVGAADNPGSVKNGSFIIASQTEINQSGAITGR